MVNIKHVIFSLILPILTIIIIPFIILIKIDVKTIGTLFNSNLILYFIGIIIFILGLILFLDCIVIFYKIGNGTLMPLPSIETKSLIIAGSYKYMRNPMITGVLLIIISEAFLFGSLSILSYAGIFLIINMIYMPLSEEKGLIKRFGEEYLEYKQNVRAWIPKLK